MFLGEVLKNINKKYRKIKFNNIKFNSRNCKPNDIFFAIKGNDLDGKKYINDAIKNGAKIIVSDLKLEGFNKNLTLLRSISNVWLSFNISSLILLLNLFVSIPK